MDENPTTDEQDAPAPSTKALLIGLGGLAVIAAVLVAVRLTRAPRSAPLLPADDGGDFDARESLEHLARAVQYRLDGLEQRVNELARTSVPAPTSTPVGNGATPDAPPEPVERIPPDVSTVGADDAGAPPGPAAVSI